MKCNDWRRQTGKTDIADRLPVRAILTFAILMIAVLPCSSSVGTWTNYMAYSEITDIKEGGNYLYVLASGSLFTYNTNDNSITTYDKATGLSDCGIQIIEWCESAKTLVIVYENGNIDLLASSGSVTNMPEYYNKTMTDDKTVYGLDVIGSYAYMSTGFGIVKINVADAEISNTYNLGFRVDYCYIDGDYIYAASSTKGTYRALTSDNLLDPSSWTYYAKYTSKTETAIDEDLLALVESLSPGGPKYNYFNYMYFCNDRLYTSGGGRETQGRYQRPGCIQVLGNDEWTIYDDDMTLLNDASYEDVCGLAVDPNDPNHIYAGSVLSGIIEFNDGEYEANYTYSNSPLTSAVDGTSYVTVEGLVFGESKSLYMLNSEAEHALVEYTSDGEWLTHDYSCLYDGSSSLGTLRRSILDSRGFIWFVNDHYDYPALFCYQPDYDAITEFSTLTNQEGTSINIYEGFHCVAEDLDNNIWVGTDTGPLLLTTDEMSDNSLGFTQVIVPRNDGTDYGDYLLESVDITCIAIDGAGRKWFGTDGNGVYVISEDNMTQEEHFLADETPLLSDYIEDIAIDGTTGTVYIGTSEGLCSYTSGVTEASETMNDDDVYAYPNPVKPDYTGDITIVGLSYDADVKIVTVNGTLVAQGRSLGGSFSWDGCDRDGKRVASGIYFVQTATSTGDKGVVCKVAIIR